MLTVFFTVVYFWISAQLIDLVFRHTLSTVTNILALICYVIALIVSVGLAEYTVKRIRESNQK